jgi:GAF domain-containing protein
MELALALFLLCGLVFLSRQRSQIIMVDKDSYRYMAGGVSILAVMTLVRILGSLGLFGSVPFLSDPFGLQLTVWTGVIAGSIFLVSGVSEYSAAARRNRLQDSSERGRVELIKRTAQLVGVESRLSTILERTLHGMVELYDLPAGAVYRYYRHSDTMSLLQVIGTSALDQKAMGAIAIDVEALGDPDSESGRCLAAVAGIPEEFGREPVVLPLKVGAHLYALFVLGSPEERLGDEAMMSLKLSSEIIVRKIRLDRHRMVAEIAARRNVLTDRLQHFLTSRTELRQGMIRVAEVITKELDSEYVSLATVDDGGSINRYTVGVNGMYLKELGLDRMRLVSHLSKVINDGQTVRVDDIDSSEDKVEVALVQAGMKSLLAVPIIEAGQVQAVITIASHQVAQFTEERQTLLESLRPILGALVVGERHELELHRLEDRSRALSGLLTEATSEPMSMGKVLTTAVHLLKAHLGMAMVRISTLEEDRTFLRSRMLQSGHQIHPSTPGDGHMVLSLMPQHEEVLRTGTTRVIDLADQNCVTEESEVCLAFAPEIRSILMLPIANKSGVIGVIALADRREPERLPLDPSTMQLAEAVAAIVGLCLPELPAVRDRRLLDSVAARASGETGMIDRNGRIESSLSGIFGSLEVLNNRGENAKPSTVNRYLAIIDKSARQLQDCLTQEAEV